MPPITPGPNQSSQSWCVLTPSADIIRPPHQQSAANTPALRGPARSSQPPQIAADDPRRTKNSVNIQPRSNCDHSHVVAVNALSVPIAFSENVTALPAQAPTGAPVAAPTACD